MESMLEKALQPCHQVPSETPPPPPHQLIQVCYMCIYKINDTLYVYGMHSTRELSMTWRAGNNSQTSDIFWPFYAFV